MLTGSTAEDGRAQKANSQTQLAGQIDEQSRNALKLKLQQTSTVYSNNAGNNECYAAAV